MPWCEPCERFYNPNTLTAQGSCPECGEDVGPAGVGAQAMAGQAATGRATKTDRVPWHFKLLVVAAGGYVGWRIIQLLVRGVEAIF